MDYGYFAVAALPAAAGSLIKCSAGRRDCWLNAGQQEKRYGYTATSVVMRPFYNLPN